MLRKISRRLESRSLALINNKMGNRLGSIAMINKITTKLSIFLDQKVCGVPMIEMIGLRILCYILLAVMVVRILGD